MGVPIRTVGQYALDAFIGNYRSESDFFDLSDFIFHCGATLGEFYRQEFLSKYAELRQEKKDEIVTFDPDVLNEVVLKVEKKDGEWFAEMKEKVFSFPFDQQTSGVQYIFPTKPHGSCGMERTTVSAVWQLQHFPVVSKIFWWASSRRINLYTNNGSNVAEIKVLYVPAISEDMTVPDSLVQMVVNTTVGNMKGLLQQNVVKATQDLSPNKILQTEINKSAL